MKILSLDGGGIRGLLPAMWLSRLEQQTGKLCYQLFDLVAGTSVGGILAAAIGAGIPMSQIEQMFLNEGQAIFRRHWWRGYVRSPRYSPVGLEAVLQKHLGNTLLFQSKVPILLTARDISSAHDVVLKSSDPKICRDWPLWWAARASSAAPTYFPPFRGLVDGGVCANNPAMCAICEGVSWGVPLGDMQVLSLGTGGHPQRLDAKAAESWGLLEWAPRIVDELLDAGEDIADFQAKQLLGSRYVRVQPDLPNSLSPKFDDASPQHIERLRRFAEESFSSLDVASEQVLQLLPVAA